MLAPALRDHALDALVALEALDLVGVDDRRRRARTSTPRKNAPTWWPKPRSIGSSSSITIVTCLPSARQRRGDLAADVRPADADDVLGAVELGADRVGVAEGAQVVDAVELGAVHLQPADHRAGRDERVLVADGLLRRERRLARRGVELHHARARQQLDGRAVEPAGLGTEARPRGPARRAGTPSSAAGRSYGGSSSRPASRTLPSNPPLTSSLRGRGGGDSAADQEDVDGAISHVRTLSRRLSALA